MIKYVKHNNINKLEWDNTICSSPNGLIYAMSWYLDVVHPNWDALVEDDYSSVMPLTGNKKLLINYLFQPFFTQQLGVFSKNEINQDKLNSFLNSIPKKIRLAEIRLNEACMFNCEHLKPHRNIILSLNNTYPCLKLNYHANTKRNLSASQKYDLKFIRDVEVADIISLFRKNRGAKITHWNDDEYSRFANLCRAAQNNKCLITRGVVDSKEQLLAGAILFRFKGRLIFIFSGRDEQWSLKQGMTFLFDSIIHEFCEEQLVLDFEGSDDDNLARFELGFGGQEVYYPEYCFNKLTLVERKIKSIFAHNK